MTAAAELPIEGELPDLGGATAWLNSEPLTPAGLGGKVVLVQFCTYSCVNWLRTLPYVRAWSQKYRDYGLVVVGVHSPEFPFEHEVEKVRPALEGMGVDFPIALDNDFAVWRAFDNNAWPALYFIDDEGRIRHHHLGEEDYERSERVIQQLLAEAGSDGADRKLVSPEVLRLRLRRIGRRWDPRRPTSAMNGRRGSSLPTDCFRTSHTTMPTLAAWSSTSGPSRETGPSVDRPR